MIAQCQFATPTTISWATTPSPVPSQMDESELMESLSFLPSSSLLFCDLEGLGGRCGTPPESPTALGRLAGRGGRPELSGVRPEDSLLIWKDAEEEGESSVAVRRQLVRRGSSPSPLLQLLPPPPTGSSLLR